MPNEPVQLLLNTGRLRAERETSTPVDNGTDFYAGNDRAFARHRHGLAAALRAIRDALAADTQFGSVGGALTPDRGHGVISVMPLP